MLKRTLKKIARKIINIFIFLINKIFGKKTCPVCKNKIIKYKKFPKETVYELESYNFVHKLEDFETFNFEEYSCPVCNTNDAGRLYALYLDKKIKKIKSPTKILEIAPLKIFKDKVIKVNGYIDYRNADLNMDDVDDKIDVSDMKIYEDNTFDIIICTHVLEHVMEDQKAMNEIYRILNKNGEAIVQVPILKNYNNDYEPKNIETTEDRWKHFGDSTHYRLYSNFGFSQKLETAGFKVLKLGVKYFGQKIFDQNAIQHDSILYIARKI